MNRYQYTHNYKRPAFKCREWCGGKHGSEEDCVPGPNPCADITIDDLQYGRGFVTRPGDNMLGTLEMAPTLMNSGMVRRLWGADFVVSTVTPNDPTIDWASGARIEPTPPPLRMQRE